MKKLILILPLAVLCGCGESGREKQLDQKVAALQSELDLLSAELATNTLALTNSLALGVADKDYCDAISGVQTMDELLASNTTARVATLETWKFDCENQGQARRYRIGPDGTVMGDSAPAMVDGVPAEVYAGIKAKAQEEWPTDYEMQNYEIKTQVTAYQQLHGQ